MAHRTPVAQRGRALSWTDIPANMGIMSRVANVTDTP